jgi:K+-transporting ATPase ATPase C chain
MRLPSWIGQHLAALRVLLVLTVIVGLIYPLAIAAVAQVPGLNGKADGSLVAVNGKTVGSSLIGQSFTDADGKALVQYFQSRPSAAGDGYDPTATSASNIAHPVGSGRCWPSFGPVETPDRSPGWSA